MILQIQDADFKNPELKEILSEIAVFLPEFEAKRKGRLLRGIFFAFAEIYTEDRKLIHSFFTKKKKHKDRDRTLPIVHQGGPKRTVNKESNCEGCPEVAVGTSTKVIIEDPKIKLDKAVQAFASIDQVLERFESNTFAIRAFAQTQQITIPSSVSKPETAAKYIVEHYQNLQEQESDQDQEPGDKS